MKACKKSPITCKLLPRMLVLDSTPAGLITAPLRTSFKYLWACLRKEHFRSGDFSCEKCKAVETEARLIHAHEVYSFLDPQVVKLERVAFLCTRCHDVIHFERSRRYCAEPYLRTLSDHYCKVNGGISQDEFRQDIDDTFRKMLAIRKFYGGPGAAPPIDYGPYQSRVDLLMTRNRRPEPSHEASADELMRRLREFSPQFAEAEDRRSASVVEALAFLRIVAEGVIRDLSMEGIAMARADVSHGASLPEALAISRETILVEALA
jgi:hypothetical protein